MRVISDINHINLAQWHNLVATSPTATWFQTPEAYDFFASMSELFMPFVVGVANENELRGVCCGYVTKEKTAFKQFFTRRAIINGGLLLDKDITDKELTALLTALKNGLSNRAIYIETRNFNDYSRWKRAFVEAGFLYEPHLNFHIDTRNKELMWNRIAESKRRQIRKAQAQGVVIVQPDGIDDIKAFYQILRKLYREKVKRPLFDECFFVSFYEQKLGKYLLVKYQGKVIGGVMCPIINTLDGASGTCSPGLPNTLKPQLSTIYEWYICGNDTDYHEQYPSVMATWAAMEYAAEHNLARFDVMGAGVPDKPYGVRDFKADFGGELVEHGRFTYIAKPILYHLGKIGVELLNRR